MKRLHLKPGMSLFACAACALGLLLWARLLLVSSPPRIATAEPVPVMQPKTDPSKGTDKPSEFSPEEQERMNKLKRSFPSGFSNRKH